MSPRSLFIYAVVQHTRPWLEGVSPLLTVVGSKINSTKTDSVTWERHAQRGLKNRSLPPSGALSGFQNDENRGQAKHTAQKMHLSVTCRISSPGASGFESRNIDCNFKFCCQTIKYCSLITVHLSYQTLYITNKKMHLSRKKVSFQSLLLTYPVGSRLWTVWSLHVLHVCSQNPKTCTFSSTTDSSVSV